MDIAKQKKIKTTETWVLELACWYKNFYQLEFLSTLQNIMDKMQGISRDAKRILLFWISNGSIITHDCDLENLFPGDPLIGDTN